MVDWAGTVLDEKYELVGLLGEGGMGAVYEAKHLLIGRRLAVKFLHAQYVTSEEVVERFKREARAAAAIGHENIIEVTDMGTAPDGAPYIVMEYLEGQDLREVLSDDGALHYARAAHIMVQSLSALQAAHNVGIIHRDLKPENIYLISKPSCPDYAKLLDFGISKFKSLEGDDAKGLTQTGTVLGTPYYMSPEQARGDQDITAQSDIYAMGVILYQTMTGILPFDAPNYNALLIKILTEDFVPPEEINPEIPPEIVEAIKIAMSREASERFPTCLDFRERLIPFVPGSFLNYDTEMSSVSYAAVQAALATQPTPFEVTRSGMMEKGKKFPLIVGGGVGVLALLLIGILIAVFSGPDEEKLAEVNPASLNPATGSDESTASASDSESSESEVAVEVEISVRAKPRAAKIRIDGVEVKGNPFKGSFAKDGVLHKIEVIAKGFVTKAELVHFDQDQQKVFTLEKVAPAKKDRRSGRRGGKKRVRDNKKGSSKSSKPASSSRPRRRIDDEDPWS